MSENEYEVRVAYSGTVIATSKESIENQIAQWLELMGYGFDQDWIEIEVIE